MNENTVDGLLKASLQRLLLILVLCFTVNTHAETAVFAGGCFWCVEALYQELDGVQDAVSGFTGGKIRNPTYRGNHRGHYEAVKVTFDPAVVSYEQLLEIFWVNIDPFDDRGQFCDKGPSYRSAIFFAGASQEQQAISSKAKVESQFPLGNIVTELLPALEFWPVEVDHQDYYLKNPIRYRFYRTGCGRDRRLSDIWGDKATH